MRGLRCVLRILCACVALSWTLAQQSARADKPAPLSAQTLKAPSGPASLKGLGESFSANPGTGTGSYSVPIELVPGQMAPQIALSYTGGSGKSEVGVGFTLPNLQIYRQTEKGAPKFDETDRFSVQGADYNDELVLVDATARLYRLKNEGSFVLFQRDSSNDRWTIFHPGGIKTVLGGSAASRAQSAGRTTRWFIESAMDAHEHQVQYRYLKDGGRVYLQGIDYQLHAAVAYRNRVEFLYEVRPDVVRDYRYGDLEEMRYRLSAIEVLQGPRRIRRYTLRYQQDALWSLLGAVELEGENGLKMPTLSFDYLRPSRLSGRFVRTEGVRTLSGMDTGRMTLEDVTGDGLPDLLDGQSSNYSYYENIDGVRFSENPVQLGVSGSPDRALDAAGVVLADVNGDGYRDVWYPVGDGRFRYFPGGRLDRGRFLGFGAVQVMNGNNVVSDVTRPEIRLTDLNGDGRTDLLYQRLGIGDVWIENQLARDFVQRTIPTLPSGVVLTDSAVEFLDFNGDGHLDLVKREFDTAKHNLKIWYGFGSGRYTASAQDWPAPPASQREVFLTDVNRDGQTDLVRVSGSWVAYYLNNGRSGFSTRHGDFRGMPETARTKKLLLADMNGNGTADVVWLTVDGGMSYLDLMGEPNVGLLSTIDNGMGSVTEISYRASTDYMVEAKLRSDRWSTPLPNPVPVISEVRIRDSLEMLGVEGWESRVIYDYRDGYYDGKEREFRGFARVIVTNFGDEYQDDQVSELRQHLGRNLTTGADEEGLKGKVWLTVIRNSAGEILSSTEKKWEQRWLCQEDLGAGAAVVLPRCAGITDKTARKDELVSFSVETGELHGVWERQSTPRYTAKKTDYDIWGRQTRVDEYGEVTVPSRQLGQAWAFADLSTVVGQDEKTEEFDYTNKIDLATGKWLIGFVTEQRLKTGSGAIVTRARTYYDGQGQVGLPLGQVERGLVTRREAHLTEQSRWVPTERTSYNSDGLPELRLDAAGKTTRLEYDPETRFHPVAERLALPGAQEAVFRAGYDRGYGVISQLTDPNQRVTQYRYDGLARLTKIIDPNGSESEPLVTYAYTYGTTDHPISTTITRQLVERGRNIYRTSIAFTDGLGRARLAKTAAEQGYTASGWNLLSAGGAKREETQTFWSTHAEFEAPPIETPSTVTYSDAFGRPLEEHLPITAEQGASLRVREYFPFETRDYSERDSTEQTFQYPRITRFDGLGRMRELEQKNVRGTGSIVLKWKLLYDVRDNLTSFKDPKNLERLYTYDSLARLTLLSDPNLGTLSYEYDDADQLTKRTDALGQVQIFQYDLAGRVEYQLNQRPDVQSGVLQNQAEYRYRYDRGPPSSPLGTPTNLVGRLSSVEYPAGTEHYSYDDFGRLERQAIQLWDGVSPLTAQQRTTLIRSATYNAAGEEIGRQLPKGFSVSTAYNARGLLEQSIGGFATDSRTIIAQATYDAVGQLTSFAQGNGLRNCRKYNARGEHTGVLVGKTSDVSCDAASFERSNFGYLHLNYAWGHDSTLRAITDLGAGPVSTSSPRRDASFQFDRIQQLISANTGVGQFQFDYDDVQNLVTRTKQTGGAPAVSEALVYGEAAGPNAVTHVGATALTYDAVGQLKRYNGYELTFDVEGRLVEARKAGGRRLEYHYDAWSERKLLIVTEPGGKRRIFRYPLPGYEERDGEDTYHVPTAGVGVEVHKAPGLSIDAVLLDELTAYVNAPPGKPKPLPAEWLDLDGDGDGFDAQDLAEAQRAYWEGRRAGTARTEWRYALSDYLGSAAHVTDSAGDVVSTRHYEPYGVLARRTGISGTRGFAGSEVEPDDDLGLVRIGVRYYAPAVQRWITPDRYIGESPEEMAKRPLESNLYSYGKGDPISNADPDGRQVTGLTTHRLRDIARAQGIGAGLSGVRFNQVVGRAFQDWALREFGVRENHTPYYSALREQATGGRARSVIPDSVGAGVGMNWRFQMAWPPVQLVPKLYAESVFFEVKAVDGPITLRSNRSQVLGMLDVLENSPAGRSQDPGAPNPALVFLTTSNTTIGPDVLAAASARGILVFQAIAFELPGSTTANPKLGMSDAVLLNPKVALARRGGPSIAHVPARGMVSGPLLPGGPDNPLDPDPPEVQ